MDTLLKPILEFLASVQQFLTRDIWRADFKKLSRAQAFFYQQLFIAYLVAKAFVQDRLLVRASALVYATLLSIVPLLAVMFSLLKGFGFHNKLEPTLFRIMAPLGEQATNTVVPTIVNFVDNVNVSALGAAGFLLLLVSVLSIINNIERAFNDIWKVKHVRSLQRRFSDYLSVLLLGPVLAFTILGITASLQSYSIVQAISKLPTIHFLFNKTAPIIASWFVFLFLIIFVPNTKVRFGSAFIGGILAGTIWQIANLFFARFIVSTYQIGSKAALYAGFATLPLFLVWLFISWAVVLLGAEISYAHQNVNTIAWEEHSDQYSQVFREGLLLKILLKSAENFYHGDQAPSSRDLAEAFRVPDREVNEILAELLEQGFLYAVDGNITRYCPAKSLETFTLGEVIQGLRSHGVAEQFQQDDHISKVVAKIQSEYSSAIEDTFAQISIRDLLAGEDK